jgi:CelD/BcsL family acetyltransferase involved in cellulose biosynthesis
MSPGMVLVAQSIRDAIEGGRRYFDFLRGDEPYKCRLTKSSRKTVTLLVARSFLAKEYLRVARLKDSVKRLVTGQGVAEPVS